MDNRKLLANAAAAPPVAPALPSVGYPTNGNPATNTPAATGGAYWFHQIAEELRNIILAAGLTPSDANLSQVLAALTAGWGMAKSLGTSGHATLPGGLILQWGTGTTAGTGYVVTNYPIAFPNAVFRVFPVDIANSLAQTHVVSRDAGGMNVNGFGCYATLPTTQAAASTVFDWFAIGN